jgi:hypothetical protein
MNTKPKWPEGPWQVEDPMGPDILSVVAHGDKPVYDWLHIAQISCDAHDGISAHQARAIAHLIAAAPELYGRLEAATKALVDVRDGYYECMSRPDGTIEREEDAEAIAEMDAEIAANQAALARARGEA